jgi:hypothetical protein
LNVKSILVYTNNYHQLGNVGFKIHGVPTLSRF